MADISQQLESLAPSDACKHMSAVSHSVVLGDGDACYIPAGHHLFTLGCGGPSFLLYQPLFCAETFHRTTRSDVRKQVLKTNADFVQEFIVRPPWMTIGHAFLAWLADLQKPPTGAAR